MYAYSLCMGHVHDMQKNKYVCVHCIYFLFYAVCHVNVCIAALRELATKLQTFSTHTTFATHISVYTFCPLFFKVSVLFITDQFCF